ncbi:MAG: RNA 2',3'-cyclic phosphodiesterase [Desulfuromonadales bacterium]|nr:RNA 2',3'-cyclic phosphodiesterase [Desulfuromonadales bacterium]
MSTVRAFVAIPLPETLKQAIAALQRQLKPMAGGIRWSHLKTIHLTVRFFGETTQENLEKIKASMLSVKRSQRSFQVTVGKLGAFPDLQRPRVVWLGITPEAPLRQLYSNFTTELTRHGIAPEARGFSPHLTIGRLRQRGSGSPLSAWAEDSAPLGELQVAEMVLYQSRLHQSGAEHIPLLTVNFDKDKAANEA